jgi:hypothetical protein
MVQFTCSCHSKKLVVYLSIDENAKDRPNEQPGVIGIISIFICEAHRQYCRICNTSCHNITLRAVGMRCLE